MKKASNIFLGMFLVSILLLLLGWPGSGPLRFFSMAGMIIVLVIHIVKVIVKQRWRRAPSARTPLDMPIEAPVPVNNTDLLFSAACIVWILHLLIKVQFWYIWVYFQYAALGITILAVVFSNKKEILPYFKRWIFAAVLCIASLIMMIVPYSTFIYYTEIAIDRSSPGSVMYWKLKCDSYGRYVWALRYEGKDNEAQKVIDEFGEICSKEGK